MAALMAVLGAAMPIAAAWSLGRFLLRWLGLPAVLQFAVGAVLLSTATFLLLLTGVARPAAFVLLTAIPVATLWVNPPRWQRPGLPPWWAMTAAGVYGALYAIHALSPEIQGDALHYHLSLAVAARSTGGFPSGITFYNVLPQGAEALFAYAYSIGGDSAARLLHFSFLAATVPLCVFVAKRLGLAGWQGWFAGLFFALTPVVGVSSTCAFNDAAMAFFVLATFALMVVWWQTGDAALIVPAGLTAGFCYALKFTGGLIAPAALLAILARRRWREAAWFTAAAMLPALPWMIRSLVVTGNPFAPLLNRYFPNPWFHIESEAQLGDFLRNYGEVDWQTIPLELTMYGDLLQGLLGPVWLLAPVGLLALRRKRGAVLVGGAVYAALPWVLNIGARFLMPGMPLAALAISMSLPRGLGVVVLAAHAVLSWPAILPRYAPADAWALSAEIPWRAALRIEPEEAYRSRRAPGYGVISLLHENTREDDRILDLAVAPAAMVRRRLVTAWESALGDRLVAALQIGASPDRGMFDVWRWSGRRRARELRLRFAGAQARPAVIQEVLLDREDGPVTLNVLSTLTAWPNVWEAPLAFDGNPATGWSTWEAVRAGMNSGVTLPVPETLTGASVYVKAPAVPIEAWTRNEGAWQRLPLEGPQPMEARNYMVSAIRYLKREGIRYILAAEGSDGLGLLGASLAGDPAGWGIQPVASVGRVTLYRVY